MLKDRGVDKKRFSRLKLMVLGNGNMGKTTLIHQLRANEFRDEFPVTDGVDIGQISILVEEDLQLDISVWDYGGQKVYQSTHPFFFTERAIYLIVWNPKAESNIERAISDFVRNVKSCAPNSPIIFVSTHSDLPGAPPRLNDLKAAFRKVGAPEDSPWVNISNTEGRGVSELRDLIIKTTLRMDHTEAAVPKSYLEAERKICAYKDLLVNKGDLIKELVPSVLTSASSLDCVLELLNDWGSIIYFVNRFALSSVVFPTPSRLAQLLSSVVSWYEDKKQNVEGGILKHEDIDAIWPEYEESYRNKLLDFLHACEVALPLPGGKSSLIPAMLPDSQPEELDDDLPKGGRALLITLDFIPSDFMSRLIVRLRQYVNESFSGWVDGIELRKDEMKGLVIQNRDNQTILLQSSGSDFPQELLGIMYRCVTGLLKLSFPGINVKNVEISCVNCGYWVVKLSQMEGMATKRGITNIDCREIECLEQNEFEDLSRGVFDGVELQMLLIRLQNTAPGARRSLRGETLRLFRKKFVQEGTPVMWKIDPSDSRRHVPLCEYDEGWHPCDPLDHDSIDNGSPVLATEITNAYLGFVSDVTDLLHGIPQPNARVPEILREIPDDNCLNEFVKQLHGSNSALSKWTPPELDAGERWLCDEHLRQVKMSDVELENELLSRCVDDDSRTFKTSKYKVLYERCEAPTTGDELRKVLKDLFDAYCNLRGVPRTSDDFIRSLFKEKIMMEGVRRTVESFVDEDDVDMACQLMWTSAETGLGGNNYFKDPTVEFCFILNIALLQDNKEMLRPAVRIARALNKFCVKRRLKKEKGETRCFRGLGIPKLKFDFFKEGVKFRMPKFLATSTNLQTAKQFVQDPARAKPGCLQALFIFDVPADCVHVNLFEYSLVRNEKDFLFAPYSVFEVTKLVPATTNSGVHEVHLKAFKDNLWEPEDLPCAPWG